MTAVIAIAFPLGESRDTYRRRRGPNMNADHSRGLTGFCAGLVLVIATGACRTGSHDSAAPDARASAATDAGAAAPLVAGTMVPLAGQRTTCAAPTTKTFDLAARERAGELSPVRRQR